MIQIDKNESPIPALSKEEVAEIISNSDFRVYPDGQYEAFLKAYADFYNLHQDQVLAANGSDEWIQKCMLALPEGPVLTLSPDFVMYTEFAQQTSRQIEYVACDENFHFSLDAILKKIDEVQPAFFIMSVPHNPTGEQYPTNYLQAISQKMKDLGGYFVVDEAYIEFGDPIDMPLEDHIIYMKTLSKAFALAGLRIGIVISTKKTIEILNHYAHPYPMSTLSLRLGEALFKDVAKVTKLIAEQRYLCRKLNDIFHEYVSDKINVIPSKANFVFTYGKHARDLGEYVLQHGFKPRIYDEPELQQAVRYSIATDEELETLKTIIKDWSEQVDLS